ncbi:MAG: hypothetical protein ABJB85_08440 [Nitrososphaerota archaeon]
MPLLTTVSAISEDWRRLKNWTPLDAIDMALVVHGQNQIFRFHKLVSVIKNEKELSELLETKYNFR